MAHTILLVDDHPVFRQGLHHLLAKEKDLRVIGEADDGEMAIELVHREAPDLVVMDINMPNIDGIEATRQILSECPDTKVVALSVHSGKQFVRDMIQAGALGYILKESIPEEMIEGIRTVLSGSVYLSKSISKILVSDYKTLIPESEPESDGSSVPLLYTKLHRPAISSTIIPRVRLIELLEKGTLNPLTLVAAPAGYGKSTLAGQWLEISKFPGAWVSLDKSDNDVRVFLSYIFEAIQSLMPQQNLSSKAILSAAALPPMRVIGRHLLNDLEQFPERFILVLDDYHLIHNAAVHEFMDELLVHPSPILHLALLTRRDPPLPLATLRGRGILTEITTSHLRFTLSETKSVLERFLHIAIGNKTAQILEDKIEGWVTGLHLAALSIRGEADQERLTEGLLKTSLYVQDYLYQEVLSNVSPQFTRYLLQSSILDRFCVSICEAMSLDGPERNQTERYTSGQDFIDWLIKAKLFVIPLDTTNRWFRYHHMFQDILQVQLQKRYSSEKIAELHIRASAWFESHNLIDEAIRHALEAGDPVRASEIVERNRQKEMNQDRWYVVGRWLSLLPPEIIQQRPALLLTRAWERFNQFRLLEISPLLERVRSLVADKTVDESLLGELDFHRGYLSIWLQGDGEVALKLLKNAHNRLPETHRILRVETELDIALARHMIGEEESAIESLKERIRTSISSDFALMSRLVCGQVFLNLMSGDLEGAKQAALRMRSVGKENNNLFVVAWSDYLQALAQLQSYKLEEALQGFLLAAEKRDILNRKATAEALAGLVYTYQAMRRSDDAVDAMTQFLEYARETADPMLVATAESCRAGLAMFLGDLDSANRWAESFDAEPHAPSALFWLEVPLITQVRVQIATGTRKSLEKALKSLGSLQRQGAALHFTCLTIEVLVLQSVALERQGRTDKALQALEEAMVLAQPGGWIRPFVEAGPLMADLLKVLHRQNVAVDYIDRILAVFQDRESMTPPPSSSPHLQAASSPTPPISPSPRDHTPQPLIEPLTNRELDVLEMLAQRFQNKEIAEKLFISVETVKGHLKSIYQKLGAGNRRETVNKAKSLGII